MSFSFSEVNLEQVDRCVNDLIIQAQNVGHLLNICIQRERAEKLNRDDDIPENLLHLGIMKNKAKKLICKEAREEGIGRTCAKYCIIPELIEKWINESVDNVEYEKQPHSEYSNGMKRAFPELENKRMRRHHERGDLMKEEKSSEDKLSELRRNSSSNNLEDSSKSKNKDSQMKFLESKLSDAEKSRIAYDHLTLGILICERKWGLTRQKISYFIRNKLKIFNCMDKRGEWMDEQSALIKYRLDNLDIEVLKCKVENILMGKGMLKEVYELSFDRGIAIAAIKYSISLLDLELLLQFSCSAQWNQMENNAWYLLPPPRPGGKRIDLDDVFALSLLEGYRYVAKKYRLPTDPIRRNIRDYYKKGEILWHTQLNQPKTLQNKSPQTDILEFSL